MRNLYKGYNFSQLKLAFDVKKGQNHNNINIIGLHGLLGQRINHRFLFDEELLKMVDNVFLVDMRNHGESPQTTKNDIKDYGNDIHQFIQSQNLSNVCLIGHSFGARAIFAYLSQHELIAKTLIKGVIILDMVPGQISDLVSVEETWKLLQALKAFNLKSRLFKDVKAELEIHTGNSGTTNFLLQSLALENYEEYSEKYKKPLNFKWKFNIESICNSYYENASVNFDFRWVQFKLCKHWGQIQVQIGKKYPNKFFLQKQIFPNMDIENNFSIIKDAGHMLHIEKPNNVLAQIKKFLSEI